MMDESQVDSLTEVYIDTLDDVKEEKSLVPAAKNVKFLIKDAKLDLKDKQGNPRNWKMLSLTLVVVNGIDDEGSYANTHLFQRICIGINPDAYDMTNKFFKNKAYLAELKNLLKALSIDATGLSLNDEFLGSIKGQHVVANITQTPRTQKNEDGERIKTGEIDNEVKYFKAVPDSDGV